MPGILRQILKSVNAFAKTLQESLPGSTNSLLDYADAPADLGLCCLHML